MPSNREIADLILARGLVDQTRIEACLRELDPAAPRQDSLIQLLLQRKLISVPDYVELLRDLAGTPGRAAAEEFDACDDVPTRIGTYEIQRRIGRGGMGTVFLAHDPALNRALAIKVLRLDIARPRAARARFRREVEALCSLQHPNIVRIFDQGEQDGATWLAMDYVEGQTLEDVLRQGSLPPRQLADLLAPLANALDACHERGVIHRDIKPANVLIDGRGNPYLTDFGLAKSIHTDGIITQTGMVVGTPVYLAPELANLVDAEPSAASDIYSLGVVLYQGLTGELPHKANDFMELIRRIGTEEPTPPSQLRRGVPRELEDICRHCMQKLPDKRYFSAGELAADLQRFRRGEPISIQPPRPNSGLRPMHLVITAALGFSLAAGAALWWQGGSPTTPPPAAAMATSSPSLRLPSSSLLDEARSHLAAGSYEEAMRTAGIAAATATSESGASLAHDITALARALSGELPLGPPGTRGQPVASVCIDGCGRPEVILSRKHGLTVVWPDIGAGEAGHPLSKFIELPDLPPGAGHITMVTSEDITGDGRQEILAATGGGEPDTDQRGVYLFDFEEDGSLSERRIGMLIYRDVTDVVTADLTGDGTRELLAATTSGGGLVGLALRWDDQTHTLTFTDFPMPTLAAGDDTDIHDLLVEDLDGDGVRNDLLVATGATSGFDVRAMVVTEPNSITGFYRKLGLVRSLITLGHDGEGRVLVAAATVQHPSIHVYEQATGRSLQGHTAIYVLAVDVTARDLVVVETHLLRQRDRWSAREKLGSLRLLRTGPDGPSFLLAWREEPVEGSDHLERSVWAASIHPASPSGVLGPAVRVGGLLSESPAITADLDGDGDDEALVASPHGARMLGWRTGQ